jgi:hypothetical protein
MNNTQEDYISELEKKSDQYFETLFKVAEHLEIDYKKARLAEGYPSDVYIESILEGNKRSLEGFCDFAKDKYRLELGGILKEFLDLQNRARNYKGNLNE